MDGNNWRAAQGQAQIPGQVIGGEAGANPEMDDGVWRTQLQPDSRQRIVNKIMDTLKRHLPFSGHEGLQELKKIAVRFEDKIYTAATSQQDYLRKISVKMLTMDTKSQSAVANSLQSNAAAGNSRNPQDQASQSLQSQIQNQVQQLPIPMVSSQSQARQQILPQNIQNNISSTGVPNSASLTSSLPSVGGMSQATMPNVPGQNSNMQNMSNVTANGIGNSMGQGVPSNIYANSQRQQIQSRQQPQVMTQEPQQQPQNSQQYLYNQQQIQQQIMKQKFHQGSVQQSVIQPQAHQQQQHNLLQQNQLQSSQQAVMQPSLRQTPASSTIQNQQTSLQQSTQSMLQQQSQSVLRQQQNSMTQHPMTANQQQQPQQLSGQQNTILDAQQKQQQQQRIIAQQNNISNMHQQQTTSQQNNLPNMHQQQPTGQQNMHQQQLGPQNNLTGFQQQQQMVGIQHGTSSLQTNQQQPVHMLQQSKVGVQQQMQSNMTNMLPNPAQQLQSQPMQPQLMTHIQSQPGKMQQQLGLQQQANTLPRDMQQRIQTSGPLLQQQTTIDQQKQMQSQRAISEVPLAPVDSSSQTFNASGGDWQEEIYQKVKSMNEMYFADLNEMFQRMAGKLQQVNLHPSLPQHPKNEQIEKLRFLTGMLERFLVLLRTNKSDIQPYHKEKLDIVEKQIINILTSNRPRKPIPPLQQGQMAPPPMPGMQQSQQLQSQMHASEGQMNSQMQPMNVQQNNLTSMQHSSLSSVSNVPNSRQNMDNLQPDSGHGNGLNQMQQVSMSSLQQNPVGGTHQMNINSLSSQNGLANLQSNVALQANSNIHQQQQIKQEQQMFSTQQMNQQYQQRQMQLQHRQQLLQQQQQTGNQQQSSQLSQQQMMQLNQMSGKPGVHNVTGQRQTFHQQVKPGAPFSVSSHQVLQATSPQIGHHSSPQIDQLTKGGGTPVQSVHSPFIVPSPSNSMAPSPMPGDFEKVNSVASSLANAGNSMHHPNNVPSIQNQSLAIGTPGISASPLLAEFTSPEGTHGVASTIVPGNPSAVEQPLDRLIKAIKTISPKALSSSVSDISSVVSMVDRIAGSAPGNGSRAAVGEDLVAMTKCRMQARNCFAQDGPSCTKKMRRYTTAVPSNVVSSTGSVNDSLKHLTGNDSDGESTEASSAKRPRVEANHALEEELREINLRLIDTVVSISEDDVDPTAAAAGGEGGEGTIVKCSYSAVALSQNLKSQYDSAQMSPIQPLRLLIPMNYPNCSPILLDKLPVEISKEYEDLSVKVNSRFSISLRSLSQPMSLGEMAKTWDSCARTVISEYVEKNGGGSFSSKYGTWDNCLTAS